MMNKQPEMTYGETQDMVVYHRKDGDRVLIYVQKGWPDANIIYNVLEQRHLNKYIDYVTIYDPNDFVKDMCAKIGISYIDYQVNEFDLFIEYIRLYPSSTKALVFYKQDSWEINQLMDALDSSDITTSILR